MEIHFTAASSVSLNLQVYSPPSPSIRSTQAVTWVLVVLAAFQSITVGACGAFGAVQLGQKEEGVVHGLSASGSLCLHMVIMTRESGGVDEETLLKVATAVFERRRCH